MKVKNCKIFHHYNGITTENYNDFAEYRRDMIETKFFIPALPTLSGEFECDETSIKEELIKSKMCPLCSCDCSRKSKQETINGIKADNYEIVGKLVITKISPIKYSFIIIGLVEIIYY